MIAVKTHPMAMSKQNKYKKEGIHVKKLIKNGYVLSMDPAIGEQKNCDVLIEDDHIVSVGPNLSAEGCEVIDASNCIVMPGFVDAHRHTWQTQLRAVAADWTLFDYLVLMRMAYSAFYTEEDAYLGNYVGTLESLNAGVTTVVDHCHLINSPKYADRLIDGLIDSGTRAVFCYGFFINPKYNPFSLEQTPGWRYDDCKRVRKERLADDSARVIFGVNPSEYDSTTEDVVKEELKLCRDLGANVISAHVAMGYYDGRQYNVRKLSRAGLIGPDMLFVHGSTLTQEELDAIKKAEAGIVSTPEVDLQMGMGHPIGLKYQKLGLRASLGLDIISNYAAEMFTQMRVMLAEQRGQENDQVAMTTQKIPGKLHTDVKDVVYLATMGGARAIHMEDRIGSLTPGKKADIQLIRTDSINMVPAAYTNPYAAVVHYANVSDVDTVIVDGKIVKQHGKLLGVDWSVLSEKMEKSIAHIAKFVNTVDHSKNADFWHQIFGGMVSMD